MSRPLLSSAMVFLLLAGCASATPSAQPAPASIATPLTTGSATIPPTPTAVSFATVAPVCRPGPLTVAEFLSADIDCSVNDDVSVVGWWGARRTDEPEAGLGWVLRGSMPFGALSQRPDELLFVDEISAAPPSGWPDGIRWATVKGRRGATDDLACHRDAATSVMAPAHCPSYLVAFQVVESEPPMSALEACITGSADEAGWVDAGEFTGYPPACFDSREITVRGWFDIRYIIAGWEAPWGISPGWLWMPIGPWTVVAPGSNPETSSALVVYADPARGVETSRTNRWVLLTGHYADPVAATCHFEYAVEFSGAHYPDSLARSECEAHFVVTSIKATNP